MNSLKIIIQATKSDKGLENEYSSFHPDQENLEVRSTIDDERDIPKKAGDKDAFSIQITKNYRVYSLIIGTSDVGGRPGFYSIRLYGPKNVNLKNFEDILYQIKEKYLSYPSTKTQQSQNYDEILSAIVPEVNTSNFIFFKNSENYVCYYDNVSSSLATIFNSKGVHLTNKLYAFQRPKEGQSSISEFRSFDELTNKLKEIEISGELRLLNEIKINNQRVEFDNRQKEITLLCYKDNIIDYILSDEGIRKIDRLTGSINIERKYITPMPRPYRVDKPAKRSFSDQYGGLILGCLMSFIIGCAGCYFLFSENYYPFEVFQAEFDTNGGNTTSEHKNELSELDTITFSARGEGTTYVADQPRFSNYSFKYAANRWSYRNNDKSNNDHDFYSTSLDNFEYKVKKFENKDKKNLIKALVQASGHEVIDKPITESQKTAIAASKSTESNQKKVVSKEKATIQNEPKNISDMTVSPLKVTPSKKDDKKN